MYYNPTGDNWGTRHILLQWSLHAFIRSVIVHVNWMQCELKLGKENLCWMEEFFGEKKNWHKLVENHTKRFFGAIKKKKTQQTDFYQPPDIQERVPWRRPWLYMCKVFEAFGCESETVEARSCTSWPRTLSPCRNLSCVGSQSHLITNDSKCSLPQWKINPPNSVERLNERREPRVWMCNITQRKGCQLAVDFSFDISRTMLQFRGNLQWKPGDYLNDRAVNHHRAATS